MKQLTNLRRKSTLLLFTLVALFAGGVSPAWGDELIVNGTTTTTNTYIPLEGNYADTNGSRSEFILPESALEGMIGDITQMTFELNSTTSFTATYQVYLKIVDNTEFVYENFKRYFSGIEGSTTVYEGNLNGSSTTLNIEFNKNGGSFNYTGGNLLVGFLVTTKGTYASTSFKGVEGSYCALYSHSNGSTTGDNVNFLPKVTFEYTPSGGVSVSKPKNVIVGSITATGATIGWDAVDGADSYELSCSTSNTEPDEEGSYTSVNTNSYNLTGLTGGTLYYVYVRTIKGDDKSKWSAVCSFTPGLLTINDVSTTTNNYVPIHGNYMDDHSRSQFILPKASLSSLRDQQITKIVFYGTADNTAKFANKTFDIYLKETEDATISSLNDWVSLEKVYSGNLTITDGRMVITLNDGFDYSGNNLLVGINQTDDDSDYTSTTWTGVSATGASLGGYGTTISQRNFLPKTSFYYTAQSSAPKMKVEAEASYDFKFLTSSSTTGDKTATFEVQNKGNAALTDANVSYSGDAAISLSSTGTLASIAAKSSTEITITVDTETPGTYSGTITLTGTGLDAAVVIPVKAIVRNTDKIFVDFDDANPKPSAWTLDEGWSVNSTNSIATIGNATAAITTSEILSAGETLTLRYRGNYDGDGAALAVSYCATIDGEYTNATETVSSIGYNVWKYATFTIPAEAKFVKVTGKYIDIDAFNGLQAPAVPVVVLSTASHNFGLVSNADTQALTLTISNEGGAALTGLSVTPSSGFAVTDMEGNALATTTIAAGSSLSVKVKMNAVGQQNGTVTISGTGIDNQTVNVSGYMLDDTKIIETFASLPDNWTQSSTLTYNSTSGVKFPSTARTLTTPKIVVGDGESVVINAKLSYSTGYITITGSTDGTNYNAFDAKTYNNSTGLNTTDYTLVIIDDIPAGTYNLRIQGSDVYVNAFNGFSYAPSLALYNNEECTTSVAAEVDKNFGFITKTQQQKYYIKNIGGGQIDLTVNTPTGFTAAIDNAALTANEKATLTITMPNTPEGLHNSSVVVTAKNHADDAVLGTFTVNLNGAVLGLRNDINIVAGELSEMPAGWERGNWSMSASTYVYNSSSTAYDMTSQIFTVAEGETMLIEAKGVNSYNDASLSYSFKVGDADWTDPVAVTGISRSDWKVFELTGASAGSVKVKFTGAYVGIRRFYGFEEASVPVMGFAAEGTTKDFGMITTKTTSDAYTITNSGAAALNGLSVTCNNENFEIAVADNATSIAAGGNVTFTVALKTTELGSQSGTVTIAGTGVEPKTFTVKGYVGDDTKIFTTFASLPDRWENSGWTFNASTGAYSSSISYKLTSPKIIVTEGQKLAISAKINSNSTYYYVTVKGSSDNGATFTAYTKQLTYDALNKDDYTVVELDDVPTTVNKIQLIGYYVYVNGLNGFTYDENDPEFNLFSDSECNTPIVGTTATNNWGFVDEDKTATYYIKNTGTGTLTLTKTDAPAGMTATLGATSLAANEITSLVISMKNDTENNEGYHGGDVVLTGKNSASETLGTFTVTSSGVVVGSKTDINFTTLSAFPAGWEADGWSVTANTKVTTSSSSKTLTTGTYTVAAGEKLVIEGRGNSSWSSPSLTYRYSTDGGSSWKAGTSTLTYTYSASDYKLQVIDDIPAGNAKIEFTGSYMDIRRIYGYTAKLEPVMALSPADASYDFQMQTAAANYEITVTNSGTANMNGVTAVLTGDDAADYQVALSVPDGSSATISENVAIIPVGQTLKVTATLKASTEYKTHNATLTISDDGDLSKAITLTGKTRNADKNYIDFASEIPSSFVEQSSWTVSSGAARTTSDTENSLITQPINLAAGEKIYFDAFNQYSGSLKVRYSVNGGISWSDYVDYTAAINTSGSFSSHEIDLGNASDVTAVIEFKGRYYIQLDNVYGGTLNNDAPMIQVKKSSTVVVSGVTEEFSSIFDETSAEYTIKNIGAGTLTITSPITTVTGVATAAVDATSLANGESATLTITMPVEAPYGEKSGAVTVKTSLGDFVINYTATTMNPNALNVDFADGNLPAGWYNDSWNVDSWDKLIYRSNRTSDSDFITQKLSVAGTSDVLNFDAKKYSTTYASSTVLKVSYSTDRMNWTEIDDYASEMTTSWKTFSISGLDAGEYYLKFSGRYASVDNIIGWTKVAGIDHDLYVTATSFPAATDKGESATISATVTSLRSGETGVYAKLFINGTAEATADAQDINLNATKTFSFTYAIPENKKAQIKVYYNSDSEAFATAENDMKVNYAFSETEDNSTVSKGTFDVQLTYTKAEKSLGTICLPFATTTEELSELYGTTVKVYEMSAFANNVITFTGVDELTAGTPYLIYSEDEMSGTQTFADKEVTATDAGTTEASSVTFHGIYAPVTAGNWGEDWYGVTSEGKIAPGTSTTTMKALRGYFTGAVANARVFIMDDEGVTGIGNISGKMADVDGDIYDLQGRKVVRGTLSNGTLPSGLYIINGKKVFVK